MIPDKYINQAKKLIGINYHVYGSDKLYTKTIDIIADLLRERDELKHTGHMKDAQWMNLNMQFEQLQKEIKDKDILIKTLSDELANRKATIKELEKHIKWLEKEHKKFIRQSIKDIDKIK